MFFQTAEPLPKQEFLAVYREAVLLTQLLFAPFGVAEETSVILGDKEAIDGHASMFQQFEDLVSKRIFALGGYDDDKIIASMHEYAGEKQDSEILQEMQAATAALHNMVLPPSVTEFDLSEVAQVPADFNAVTPRTAALLLHRVLACLIPTLYGERAACLKGTYYSEGATLYSQDALAQELCGTTVPLCPFSPACEFTKAPFSTTSLRSERAVRSLLGALTVPVEALLSAGPALSVCDGGASADTPSASFRFTLQQYHCLLDLFGDSVEVQAVLAHYAQLGSPGEGERPGVPTTVQAVRTGLLLSSLNLSAHPTVCHISQLAARLQGLRTAQGAEGEEQDDGVLEEVQEALDLAHLCLARRAEATEAAQEGKLDKAEGLLSDELLDLCDGDQGDEGSAGGEEDEQDAEQLPLPLPSHMLVELWTDRASFRKEQGNVEGALEDTDRAIALSTHSAPAYSLRAQLRLHLLDQQDQEEQEEGRGVAADSEPPAEKVAALEGAAEDALLAFLLAGSSDMALAASAEEAAREACRHSAKAIFRGRRRRAGSLGHSLEGEEDEAEGPSQDNLPRSWLVGSYFGAYEPLSAALSVYALKGDACDEGQQQESVSHAKEPNAEETDHLGDIDEGDHVACAPLPGVPVHLTDPSPCERDREGYALLLALMEVLEAVTYDAAARAESSTVLASPADLPPASAAEVPALTAIDEVAVIRHRDVVYRSASSQSQRKVVRSVAASLLEFAEGAGVDSLARAMGDVLPGNADPHRATESDREEGIVLVAKGVCGRKGTGGASREMPEPPCASEKVAPSPQLVPVRASPCRHYSAVLSLLRGEGWAGFEGVTPVLPPSVHGAVGALTPTDVVDLTGVVFRPDGSVVSVYPAPLAGEGGKAGPDAEGAHSPQGSNSSNSSNSSGSEASDDEEDDDDEEDEYGYGYGQQGRTYGKAGRSAQEEFLRRAFGLGDSGSGSDGEGFKQGEGEEEEDGEEDGEESEWETVSGSESGGDDQGVEGDTVASPAKAVPVAPAKAKQAENETTQKPTAAQVSGNKGSGRAAQIGKEESSGSRQQEVAAALREVEAQLKAHNLEDRTPEPVDGKLVKPVATEAVARPSASVDAEPAVVNSAIPAAETIDSQPELSEPAIVQSKVMPPPLPVSRRLRARLLSVCASIAYLAGDADGAVQCLRASLDQDPALLDTQIKLGSLLVDMDEMKEAGKLLKAAHKRCPTDVIALLHLAEMQTHKSNFDEAVHLLRKARRLAEAEVDAFSPSGVRGGSSELDAAGVAQKVGAARVALLGEEASAASYHTRAQTASAESLANVIALLGINLFRQLPTRPEVSLHLLQGALRSAPFEAQPSAILLLCAGEVYSQAGDMVTALDCFQKAQRCAPHNPLCYINAARTYQQLNQISTAERHLQAALLLDPAMAMVRVDLAQNLLLSGRAAEALRLLDEAVGLAKQVSEIRDVLTARAIAAMQMSLEEKGLYCSSGARSINN